MQDGIKRSKGISNISSLGLINDEVRKGGVGGGRKEKKLQRVEQQESCRLSLEERMIMKDCIGKNII